MTRPLNRELQHKAGEDMRRGDPDTGATLPAAIELLKRCEDMFSTLICAPATQSKARIESKLLRDLRAFLSIRWCASCGAKFLATRENQNCCSDVCADDLEHKT
jgi:hypothetical protein